MRKATQDIGNFNIRVHVPERGERMTINSKTKFSDVKFQNDKVLARAAKVAAESVLAAKKGERARLTD